MKKRKLSKDSDQAEILTKGMLLLLTALALPQSYAYGPGFATEPPAQVLYSNLTGLVLDCLARGEPPPIVDWVDENGNVMALSPNFARRLDNGSLHFLPLAFENLRHPGFEETRIRCRASNPYGIIVSRVISVRPVVLNQVSVRVVSDPVLKFNTAVLRCQVPQLAAPYTKIQSWQRGNIIIYPTTKGDGKYHVVPSGDLHILRVDQSDAAVAYVCRVKNILTGIDETSQPFHILVQEDLSLTTKPKELSYQDLYYSVKQDEAAVLACNVQSNPPPAFSWFRVRNNLLEPLSLTNRVHLAAGILVIEHVQLDDGGQYRCTARNERGEVNLIMNLDVAADISVDVVPPEQIIDIGRQARLECLTDNKNGLTVTWMKDGLPLSNHRRLVMSQNTLEIFNLQREDYGMYQCFVSRGALEAQAASELRLGDAAPVMIYRFIDQTLQPGPPVSLKCSARGSPTPQVTWTLHGFPLPKTDRFLIGQYVTVHGEVVSHVNISRVEIEDGGLYSCIVDNRAGTTKHEGRLNIYGPPYVHPIPELKAVVGKEFTFNCPASGYPIDRITWSKENSGLPVEHRQRVFDNGTLVISKVSRKDAGLYSCTATDRQGTSSTQSGTIKVIVPPTINKFSVGEHLRLGQRVSMLCSVTDGDLPIHLQWYRDDRLLIPGSDGLAANGDVSITEIGNYESVLRIDDLRPEHNANYTCVAENYAGKVQHSLTLKVKVAPVVESFTFPKNLTRGKRLRTVCTVTEGDLPIEIEWKRDGITLLSDASPTGPKVRRIDEYTSLLAIASLETGDAGNYSCVASNAVAEIARSAVLTIRVPPEWIVKPNDFSAVEGQDVIFQCRVAGIPMPSITWRKLEKDDSPTSRRALMELNYQRPVYRNYRLVSNGSLLIEHAGEEDEGKLMCEADNGVNEPLVKVVTLNINAPPKFVATYASPVTGRTKEAVDLVCEATGDDHISIKWLKDGKDYLTMPGKSSTTEIRELERVTSKLKIVDADKEDAGRYSCQATNAFGTSHLTIDVNIWEPPPTPDNLTILEVTSRSVKIGWSLETASPSVDRIVIQWKEHTEDWYPEGKQNIQVGHLREALIPSLNPWTFYHLRLFAENQLGKSKEGKVLQFLTHGEKPSGSPRNIRITGLSSTSLEVTWDDPEKRLLHGPVTRYSLGYREYNSQNYRFVDVDKSDYSDDLGSSCRFIINRLRKFSKYEIIVRAINSHGEGPLSRPSVGQTQEDVPDGAPEKVHCVSLTSSSVQVSWHPPEVHLRNGVVKGYKVHYAPHPGRIPVSNLPLPKVSRLSSVTTILESLRKFSNYSIQVSAFTGAGDGKLSSIVTCATHTDVPGSPKSVKVAVKSPRSVIVSWLEPEQSNGIIERYHIYLRRIHPHVVDRSHNKYTRPADVRWISIEDLEPDRQYQFWVTAVTAAGEGLSSNVVTQTPSSRVPASISTLNEDHFLSLGAELTMDCRSAGEPPPTKKWFFNGREEGWLQQRSLFADTEMDIPNLSKDHEGNYTCYVENNMATDSVNHRVVVQEPPKAPTVHIVKSTATAIVVRWRAAEDGNSPLTKIVLNYKMTYGEWADTEVVWHKQEETLTNLHCGREYHIYVVVYNSLGASPASQILTTKTLGSRPTGPTESADFVQANTTFLSLKLDLWRDNRCDILYFVVEYRHEASDQWTTVTNDLQPQMRYSIRGLVPNTNYELKVTAHNHAGSTTLRYSVSTLAENYSGAAPYENGSSHIHNVFMGLGVRTILLILVSSICLVLSSIGVCVCLRKKHSPHVGMRYGEIPKSCTMDARHNNIEHQVNASQSLKLTGLYATIQRKQAPIPPFTGATNVSKGFDTIDRLKIARGVGETRMSTAHPGPETGGILPQSGTELCPYAASAYYQTTLKAGPGRCATLGRIKTLEMKECQGPRLHNDNHVKIKESKEYTLSLGRSHKLRRKPYSESEEYDTDSSAERADLSSRADSASNLNNRPQVIWYQCQP